MTSAERRWATLLGRGRAGGMGIVLNVIGWFLTEEALDALIFGPYGAWVLAGVGVGLVAYGAYAVMQARYRLFYA